MELKQPIHFYIEIERVYKNKVVNQDFFDKNPTIAELYSKKDADFNNIYVKILELVRKTGMIYKITITENEIKAAPK